MIYYLAVGRSQRVRVGLGRGLGCNELGSGKSCLKLPRGCLARSRAKMRTDITTSYARDK